MGGPLYIQQGSPNWWLSPGIWVTAQGDPSTGPHVVNPVAGKNYTVWVEVQNFYPDQGGPWVLFVCWGIPFTGTMPSVNIEQILEGRMTPAGPVGGPLTVTVPPGTSTVPGISVVAAGTTWTPSFENNGHECLVAAVYDPTIGAPAASILLDGDATWNQAWSVAQYNFSHVEMPGGQIKHLPFPFLVCNAADEEGEFVIETWQAPLEQIAHLLPGEGGRIVMKRPGKVSHLGIVDSAKVDSAELRKAPAKLPSVKVPRRSTRPFTLSISLEEGNALIHVTQRRNGRLVGGLSVLATAKG